MKAFRLLLVAALAALTITSCVKDELYEDPNQQPPIETSDVMINEVLSTGAPDYIELYNKSDNAIDISDYLISDSGAEFTVPSGTSIPAKGFYVLDCSDEVAGFKISSGGELLSLKDNTSKLIDQLDLPSLADYDGLSYSRIPDGSTTWEVTGTTKGATNSNSNTNPVITADPLDEFTSVYEVSASDADGISSVKLVIKVNSGIYSYDMPLIDGKYQVSIPTYANGTRVEYYVEAKDMTGKVGFYPETVPTTFGVYYVTGGKPLFFSVSYTADSAINQGNVTFTADVYDNDSVVEVKLYYILSGEVAADKVAVILTRQDSVFVGQIPAQDVGETISYYLRAENTSGGKTYYPYESVGGSFNHDNDTTWPNYTVKLAPSVVINELTGTGTPDFIEIYNITNAPVDISGYKISDSSAEYILPSGTTIPAHGFIVLLCNDGNSGLETNFKISSGGELITLKNPTNDIVDQINLPAIAVGKTYSRIPDGGSTWAETNDTQGATNGN